MQISKIKDGIMYMDYYVSHLCSYWCIRRTQYIPRFGGGLQESGNLLGGLSDPEELVGVIHRR